MSDVVVALDVCSRGIYASVNGRMSFVVGPVGYSFVSGLVDGVAADCGGAFVVEVSHNGGLMYLLEYKGGKMVAAVDCGGDYFVLRNGRLIGFL